MLRAVAVYLNDHNEPYERVRHGRTQSDHLIDVDGGIGNDARFMPPKAVAKMPDDQVYLDGPVEQLAGTGQFSWAPHLHAAARRRGCISKPSLPPFGCMLESSPRRCSPVCPLSSNPATATVQVTEACFR